MRTVFLTPPHSCTLFSSITELPEYRRVEMNCFLVQDTGVGSDLSSVERHFGAISGFLSANQVAEAADELANLIYAFNFMLERFSPRSHAFGCLIHAVDGVPVTDLTEDGLTELLKRLSEYGLTAGMVETELAILKKKSLKS